MGPIATSRPACRRRAPRNDTGGRCHRQNRRSLEAAFAEVGQGLVGLLEVVGPDLGSHRHPGALIPKRRLSSPAMQLVAFGLAVM